MYNADWIKYLWIVKWLTGNECFMFHSFLFLISFQQILHCSFVLPTLQLNCWEKELCKFHSLPVRFYYLSCMSVKLTSKCQKKGHGVIKGKGEAARELDIAGPQKMDGFVSLNSVKASTQ